MAEHIPGLPLRHKMKDIKGLIAELETLMKLDGSRPFSLPHSSLEIGELDYAEVYYPELKPHSSINTGFVFWRGGIYAYEPDYDVPAVVLYKTEDGAPSWTNLGVIVYNQATYGGLCFTTYGEGDVIFDPFGIIQMKKDIEIAAGKKFLSNIAMANDKFIDLGNAVSGLPTANATNRGKLAFVEGASGARDRVYQCMKSDSDDYSWVEIANGGA